MVFCAESWKKDCCSLACTLEMKRDSGSLTSTSKCTHSGSSNDDDDERMVMMSFLGYKIILCYELGQTIFFG